MCQIGALFYKRRHFRHCEQHVQEYVRGAEVLVAVTCTHLKETLVGVQMQSQVEADVCGGAANDRSTVCSQHPTARTTTATCVCVCVCVCACACVCV